MRTLLLIEDDISFSTLLETFLSKKDFRVTSRASLAKAKAILKEQTFDVILSDMRLPDSEDLEIIPFVTSTTDTPIIMMTSYAEINLAVTAIQLGAIDYLEKPIQPSTLLSVIEKALKEEKPTSQNQFKKTFKKQIDSPSYIKGTSDASKKLYEYIELVAPTPMSVLIVGESGTGKENIAQTIHEQSNRSAKPFVAVDCGSIPKEIASSEFFGHVKGSFTGALNDKQGHFTTANGGTLFLDEIGNLSYELQVQLLRALQERKIRPIGSEKEFKVDIRLIAATNSDLPAEVEKGNFREDLLHRINEFLVQVPALRERSEDLHLFINYFVEKSSKELNKTGVGVGQVAMQSLLNYHWPGNLRELQNVIKRSVLLTPNNSLINVDSLPNTLQGSSSQTLSISPLHDFQTESNKIEKALEITGGNKVKAAKLLQIDRKTLYNKLKRYNIIN